MFICQPCHAASTRTCPHDFKDSWGPCEVCGITKGCADCHGGAA
jgi:hypothetical protein